MLFQCRTGRSIRRAQFLELMCVTPQMPECMKSEKFQESTSFPVFFPSGHSFLFVCSLFFMYLIFFSLKAHRFYFHEVSSKIQHLDFHCRSAIYEVITSIKAFTYLFASFSS